MRFSIRELLWLTVIVALVAGWWVDHRRLHAETVKLNRKILDLHLQYLMSLPGPSPRPELQTEAASQPSE